MIFLLLLALKYRLANFLIMGLLLLPNKISFILNTPSFRNFPILNTDNPICKLGDLVVMGNHHKGLVKLLAAYFQQAEDIAARPAVEVARRFVCQYNRRFRYQSAGNSDALLLAAGKIVRHIVQLIFQTQQDVYKRQE